MTHTNEPLTQNEIGRRQALARFGYGQPTSALADEAVAHEWALLAPDFLVNRDVATLGALPAELRAAAEDHVRQRREVDRLMLECDAAHARIAAAGAVPELVEAYTVIRDRFEDAVERFAAHREEVTRRLNAA